jgi:hypothetical protein
VVFVTKTKASMPRAVANVEIYMASFRPIRFSSAAPTREPGRLRNGTRLAAFGYTHRVKYAYSPCNSVYAILLKCF